MATRTPHDPFDTVRDAFSDLGTSEKAAFVLEATFETLGQAISETGRRAASIIDDLDIDSWFRAPDAENVGAPPPPPPAPAPPVRTPSAEAPPAAKPGPKKTAGKPTRRPPTDDEA